MFSNSQLSKDMEKKLLKNRMIMYLPKKKRVMLMIAIRKKEERVFKKNKFLMKINKMLMK
jgi:hypothetical protein